MNFKNARLGLIKINYYYVGNEPFSGSKSGTFMFFFVKASPYFRLIRDSMLTLDNDGNRNPTVIYTNPF